MENLGIAEVLGPGGIVAENLPEYEHRSAQLEMAHAVQGAFETGRPLLVEAGTGIGKSFAYLVPAILQAVRHRERVIISTHTISLQEQLVTRDIPFLRRVLPFDFKAALIKGRSNFVCLRRLDGALRRQRDFFEGQSELDELARIAAWARETADGSLSDFEDLPDSKVWSQVAAESGNCMGRRSPHHHECFYQLAHTRAREADILVVNHHLLFADLQLRAAGARYLPEADRLILDEAHSVEAIAAEHLGGRLSRFGILRLLNTLWNPRTRKGLARGRTAEKDVAAAVRKAKRAVEDLFDSLRDLKGDENPYRMRTPGRVHDPLTPALARLREAVAPLRSEAATEEEETEVAAAIRKVEGVVSSLAGLLGHVVPGQVYWLESTGPGGQNEEMRSAPIRVADTLREWIFEKTPGVVMTSATLSVGGDDGFSFLRDRLGVPDPTELELGSPFLFRDQVRIVIPRDLPEPKEGDRFLQAAADRLATYLDACRGRAFVLFTNHAHLRRVAELMDPFFKSRGISCLVQGQGLPRAKMLEQFRTDVGSVLFGADSFWEGVDVPGEALSNVFIVKLPFQVPSRPLVEARLEEVEQRGGNSFEEVMLPEAALRLKQGFGRLIRSRTDRGVVAILDPRILRRRYGEYLLRALPDCEVMSDWPEFAEEASG